MSDLIEQIDALLAIDAKGNMVPHGIGGLARELLTRCRNALASLPPAPAGSVGEETLWREMVQAHASAMRMVIDAIEHLFGPIANMESEDASLLRGPEPHHRAEGVIEALQRIATALAAVPAPPVQEPVAITPYCSDEQNDVTSHAAPSPLPAQEAGWQPIETAPKTGPAFLVWCPDRHNTYLVIPYNGRLEHFGPGGDPLRETPTHWRPLPDTPDVLS